MLSPEELANVRRVVYSNPMIFRLSRDNSRLACIPCGFETNQFDEPRMRNHLLEELHQQNVERMQRDIVRNARLEAIKKALKDNPLSFELSPNGHIHCKLCLIEIDQIELIDQHIRSDEHQMNHFDYMNTRIFDAFRTKTFVQLRSDVVDCCACQCQVEPSLPQLQAHILKERHLVLSSGYDPSMIEAKDKRLIHLVNDKVELEFRDERVWCKSCFRFLSPTVDNVIEHINRPIHRDSSFTIAIAKQNQYNTDKHYKRDLAEMMIINDIPCLKSSGMAFILEMYSGRLTPSDSSLRMQYVEPVYLEYKEEVREAIGSNYIEVFMDEMSDDKDRKVVCLLVCPLLKDHIEEQKIYFWDFREFDSCTGELLFDFITESLTDLWNGTLYYNRLLGFNTDGGSNMKSCADMMKEWYDDCLHIVCLCHKFHHIAELIQQLYPDVHGYVTAIGHLFSYSGQKKHFFRDETDENVPFRYVKTRWCTWLQTVVYHSLRHLDVGHVILQMNPKQATVETAGTRHLDPYLQSNIDEIAFRYSCIIDAIRMMEKGNLSSDKSKQIVDNLDNHLSRYSRIDLIGKQVYDKFCNEVKSSGYLEVLKFIDENPDHPLTGYYRNIQFDNAESERFFSFYNSILRANRQNYTLQNLKMWTFCYVNAIALGKRIVRESHHLKNYGLDNEIEVLPNGILPYDGNVHLVSFNNLERYLK